MNQPHAAVTGGSRKAYYQRIDPLNLAPLWESLHNLVPPEPQPRIVPALWRYDDVRPYLTESGELITAQEAIRRVLILENPAIRGQAAITGSLYAGLQLILPGEIAPSHRHTQSALRFVMEGEGAYTAVDGEKALMYPGDFLITPSWTWHDHGNDSDRPMVWLDGLDIPIITALDAGFAENYPEPEQPLTRPVGDSPRRYGRGTVPVDWQPEVLTSPQFHYPYSETRATLEAMRKADNPDPCHGHKVRYINPATGGWAMPTIGTFMQLLPADFTTRPYRCSDSTVYTCVEGEGETVIDGQTYTWGPRDLFVVPSWLPHHHRAARDSVLFSYSDRPIQQALGVWREARE